MNARFTSDCTLFAGSFEHKANNEILEDFIKLLSLSLLICITVAASTFFMCL